MEILTDLSHRTWPLPARRPIMTQTWHNLLFAHWPVDPALLRAAVPAGLPIDTFEGQAWLGLVVFRLSGVRLLGLPEVGAVSHFPEINVRTYVTVDGKPGVYFLSLDANNPLAIAFAKPWFRLAYHVARIRWEQEGDSVTMHSRRQVPGGPVAAFAATYHPCSGCYTSRPGTLEHWLTERYCYYTPGAGETRYRCAIHHRPWSLQRAQATITRNSMATTHGLALPDTPPLLHYARHMEALIWPLECLDPRRQARLAPVQT